MARSNEKYIYMRNAESRGMSVFGKLAKIFAFVSLYLFAVSALGGNAVRHACVVLGAAVAAAYCVTNGKKRLFVLGGALLYVVLCCSIGYAVIGAGAGNFVSDAALAGNTNMHWGFASPEYVPSTAGDFVFSSVLAVILGAAVAALADRSVTLYIIAVTAVAVLWLCLGFFPAYYTVAMIGVALILLLVYERGLTLKAAVVYTACAAVVFAAALPCFLYGGSEGVKNARSGAALNIRHALYGEDSLPEGRLALAQNMSGGDTPRLTVEISALTPALYLKGYVGGELVGNAWFEPDRTLYVTDGYQGIVGFLKKHGMPATQFASYSALNGNANRYAVSVKNVDANRRYVYTPYSASSFDAGAEYYDLGLRSNIFTSPDYHFTVFGGDVGGERITQAAWVTSPGLRTADMTAYLAAEGEYRAFVHRAYTGISDARAELILDAMGETSARSVNTVTQVIRAFFMRGYAFSKTPDAVGADFISEFFGGEIVRGNAPMFASAATYIFRAYGFPARYVEGYYVREDVTERERVNVTDDAAHAWTEVYFDSIGWLPIEVTPTFFTDEGYDTLVSPENPEAPSDPIAPEIPPVDPDDPVQPDDPPEDKRSDAPQKNALLSALEVLLPISSIVLVVLLTVTVAAARRLFVIAKKRRVLEADEYAYGHAAYTIVNADCKAIGGFSVEVLAELGVTERESARFIEIAERSVYGGYVLNENEKNYMRHYIDKVADVLMRSSSGIGAFINRYIRCIGL